jgi:hypothetical protein
MILTTHGIWPLLGKHNYWRFSRDGVEHILTDAGFRVSRVVQMAAQHSAYFQLLNLYVDLWTRGKLIRVSSPILYVASNLLGEALDNRTGGREGRLSCEDYTSIAYSVNYIGIGRKGS